MTKISQYSTDVNITGNDKWIGSDAQNFLITKNFTPNNLASFFNENNVIDIGTSIRYRYQTLLPGEAREQGTISFETEIGPQVNFSAITTFLIAKNTLKGNTVSQYLDFLVDSKVLLSKASNINIFGYYKITSIEPWIPNTNFFVVEVDFLAGNGFISEDLDYLVSLVDKASGSGATPNLQEVVNTGNGISNFGGTGVASIQSTNFTSGRTLYLNDNLYPTIRLVDNNNASNYLQIDVDTLNIDGVSYNWSSIVNPATSLLSALPFTTDHLTATNNQYVIGDLVWYLGNVYRCIANNDSIIPTSSLYWTNLSTGYPLVQQPSDWNSTSGNNQILNKPTIPTVGTWGALNYPTWSTGTPFVKMTAAGTFALDTNTYVTTANLTLQNAYNNSTDATIILDATRGDIKVKSIAGLTKSMSFFDPLGNEVLTFHSEPFGANIKRISANNNGFIVDSGSNIQANNLTINNIYSSQEIYLSNNKSLISYSNPLVNHYFKGTSGVKWESDVKIEYAADYSALYSNRSLVDKEYVDGLITSGVTAVTATSPITSSGGSTPDISTSMATNKLIGRSTAGVGVMEEITIGTGLTLSGGTLSSSVTGGIPHATAAGTDTYTTTITGVTAYNDADAYLIRFTNGNTTGVTLNINSLGAIPLYRNNDGPLLGGDILAGGEMLCIYNSTTNRFQVIGISPNSLIAYVTNDDSVTLTKGMPVYAFSGTGDRMTVKRANNTGDATSAQTVGLVLSTSIAANQKGVIMMQGLLDGLSILPTSTWADGDAVYLGATPGSITNVKPFAPNHLVYLGVVTTASNGAAGRMYVRVQNGYELQELHNVQAQSPSLNDTLWYDNTVSPAQWKTASISTVLGFTPENVANKQTDLTASATKYPTVNAVNTGLALKQNILSYTPYRNIQTSQTVHTGTTTETVIFTATIPAGAFSSTDVIKVLFGANKSTALGTYLLRLRVNTTNTISGAPTIASYSGTATAQVNVMMRNYNLNGGNLYGFMFTTSGLTDITAQGGSLGSTVLNPSNQFFIFATITLNNSGDSIIGNMFSIHN